MEVSRDPAGPAGRVDGRARGQGVEDRQQSRLLDLEDGVGSVECRPAVVGLPRAERHDLDAGAPAIRVGEQLAQLGQPGPDERLVVLPGERAEQRDALDPGEVRERVLEDRRRHLRDRARRAAAGRSGFPETPGDRRRALIGMSDKGPSVGDPSGPGTSPWSGGSPL
jgi:hypothetical protein